MGEQNGVHYVPHQINSNGSCYVCTFYYINSLKPLYSIVADTIPPNVENCPNDISVTFEKGEPGVRIDWIVPTATDLSPPITMTSTAYPNDLFSEGETFVTYTFTDSTGNSNSLCSFIVTATERKFI